MSNIKYGTRVIHVNYGWTGMCVGKPYVVNGFRAIMIQWDHKKSAGPCMLGNVRCEVSA
jgi:hypothetical protein